MYINPKYGDIDEQLAEFNPELDNYVSETEVQNAIQYIPLFNSTILIFFFNLSDTYSRLN